MPNAKILAPTHVKRGDCTAFSIDKADVTVPTYGEELKFPNVFKNKIFLDPSCAQPITSVLSVELPITLYLKSETLLQEDLSVQNGNGPSAKTLVTVYKEQFVELYNASPAIVFSSPVTFQIKYLVTQNYSEAAPNVTRRGPTTASPLLASDNLLGKAGYGSDAMSFSKTSVYLGTVYARNEIATSVAAGSVGGLTEQACFSTGRTVKCPVGRGPIRLVPLPQGQIFDLGRHESGLNSLNAGMCAIVDGRVYCWDRNLTVTAIPALGSKNIMLADASGGILCGLTSDKTIACNTISATKVMPFTTATRIFPGGYYSPSIVVEYDNGQLALVRPRVANPIAIPIATTSPHFDEIVVSFTDVGCGRAGSKVYCFEASTAAKKAMVEMTEPNLIDIFAY